MHSWSDISISSINLLIWEHMMASLETQVCLQTLLLSPKAMNRCSFTECGYND
jgi:hypothetical protein